MHLSARRLCRFFHQAVSLCLGSIGLGGLSSCIVSGLGGSVGCLGQRRVGFVCSSLCSFRVPGGLLRSLVSLLKSRIRGSLFALCLNHSFLRFCGGLVCLGQCFVSGVFCSLLSRQRRFSIFHTLFSSLLLILRIRQVLIGQIQRVFRVRLGRIRIGGIPQDRIQRLLRFFDRLLRRLVCRVSFLLLILQIFHGVLSRFECVLRILRFLFHGIQGLLRVFGLFLGLRLRGFGLGVVIVGCLLRRLVFLRGVLDGLAALRSGALSGFYRILGIVDILHRAVTVQILFDRILVVFQCLLCLAVFLFQLTDGFIHLAQRAGSPGQAALNTIFARDFTGIGNRSLRGIDGIPRGVDRGDGLLVLAVCLRAVFQRLTDIFRFGRGRAHLEDRGAAAQKRHDADADRIDNFSALPKFTHLSSSSSNLARISIPSNRYCNTSLLNFLAVRPMLQHPSAMGS